MTKSTRSAAGVMLLAVVFTLPAISTANDFSIESFSRNGEISWTDTNTNGHYRVEWCPSLMQTNWHGDWSGLAQIPATGGVITVSVPRFYRVVHRPQSTQAGPIELRLVAGGGQFGGPTYDFYMSRYETTEAQFVAFLNDAEANSANARGSNMFFDQNGDVYMDATEGSQEWLFDISDSNLIYTPGADAGSRYGTFPDTENHPITGVSWFGAVKFCNWLTIDQGRGETNRCYSEGTAKGDWHPVNITQSQWEDGFDNSERMQWITDYQGFRLPMTGYSEYAGHFNEFYKAAAWTGATDSQYAFGRDSITGADANYDSSGDPFSTFAIPTTPVGFYDGATHYGFPTTANANLHGIHDLSGNVSEWSNDTRLSGHTYFIRYGGNFNDGTGYLKCNILTYDGGHLDYPWETRNENGFRVATSYP